MAAAEASESAEEAHEREQEREVDESWRFVVPPLVIPSSQAELEELKTLGYDGEIVRRHTLYWRLSRPALGERDSSECIDQRSP